MSKYLSSNYTQPFVHFDRRLVVGHVAQIASAHQLLNDQRSIFRFLCPSALSCFARAIFSINHSFRARERERHAKEIRAVRVWCG